MYTYIYFFLQNKNTEISHKAPTMGIKLEKNHFRKLCLLNSKNTRVKIATLIILPRSCQAEINLNIEDYICQVPA